MIDADFRKHIEAAMSCCETTEQFFERLADLILDAHHELDADAEIAFGRLRDGLTTAEYIREAPI